MDLWNEIPPAEMVQLSGSANFYDMHTFVLAGHHDCMLSAVADSQIDDVG